MLPPFVRFEHLETRALLHGLSLDVNFQPGGVATPAGYVADTGAVFGNRGNGFSYGWNAINTANTRDRNLSNSPDQRYDTLNHMQKSGNFSWELAVENGDYQVRVVMGDPGYTDSVYKVDVEGLLTVNGTPSNSQRWKEGTSIVTVTDGRLTITNASGAVNNRICFVEIDSWHGLPEVGIAATDASAAEPNNHGLFTVTRTGSTTADLVVNYLVGGTAGSASDYSALSGSVTIPAGSASATVSVNVLDDSLVEQPETVVLTLQPAVDYEVSGSGSATVTIGDNDGAAPSFSTRINFQPSSSTTVPDYYRADTGAAYGLRSNGLTYGWNTLNTANTRDRNSASSPDERYDTLNHMQNGGTFSWEIAVANGTYTVRVVAGDPSYYDGIYKINVEGVLTVNGTASSSTRWFEGTSTVSVADGRLTISNASGADKNKIAFVEIISGANPIPVVSVAATDNTAGEAGTNPGVFTFTRTGSTAAAMVVDYVVSGTASNGTDFAQLFSSVTIPAGQASATVTVSPVDDASAEGSESVKLTIASASRYTLGFQQSATVTILDNDTAGTLSWSQKATGFARAEAMRASIGGKLYVLGGYVNGQYLSSPRFDVYDPNTNVWTQLGDMPQGLTHAGVANDSRYIYVAGGYTVNAAGTGQVFAVNNVRRYDTQTATWTSLKNLPAARGGGALGLVNNTLYFVAGSDISRADKSDVWSLDLSNPNADWVTRASLPQARNHFGVAELNGMLYAVAGQTGQDAASVFRKNVYRYDPSTNVWTEVASLINQPRSHAAAATFVHNGKIIIAGGETDSGTPGVPLLLRNVESYDPATNTWSSLAPLPQARTSGVAASFGDRIIFACGQSGGFRGETWVGTFV